MIDAKALADVGDAAESRGDFAFARRACERGAALGCEICLDRLAYIFDDGLGMEADKQKARRLYRSSWRRRRSVVASNNLAILYRERGDARAMVRWRRRGAAAGDGDGDHLVQFAKCYLDGRGVRESEQSVLRCLQDALASGTTCQASEEEAVALLETLRPRLVSAAPHSGTVRACLPGS